MLVQQASFPLRFQVSDLAIATPSTILRTDSRSFTISLEQREGRKLGIQLHAQALDSRIQKEQFLFFVKKKKLHGRYRVETSPPLTAHAS